VTIRVVIADDHRVVRDGLCYLLGQEPDIEVAGEAGDGRQAVDVVAATRPDVLLLDLYMPELDGHAVLAALHDAPHRPAVVVLTSATDDEHLVRAMHAGATSYLLKTASAEHVIAAIRDAAAGTASLSPDLLTRLTHALHRPPLPDPLRPLSPREREVLRLIARGRSNRHQTRPARPRTGRHLRPPPPSRPRPGPAIAVWESGSVPCHRRPGLSRLVIKDRLGVKKVIVMRVFVAGGTGAIGQRLVPQLVARGHQVTATTTSAAKLGLMAQLGAEGVVMDGLDAMSVGEAVARAAPDAIVHQMTALSAAHAGKPSLRNPGRFFATTLRLRTEGTDHLLAAAEAAGVSHLVAQSFAQSFTGGPVLTEEDRPDLGPDPMMRRMAEGVLHVEDAVAEAGGAALRYGGLYGPGATDDQVELVRKRKFPLVGSGTGYFSWVHLDDAASATVLAVEQRARGVFNIVDDEPAPVSEWLPYLAACAGAKRPMRVPRWLARLLAGEFAVKLMTEGRGFSNAKAKRELGWQLRYPSWRQGFKEELA
jgi:DNA-binding NarL/FixJ family response regulator/nucleoside-diphosphate-sugar epimerase